MAVIFTETDSAAGVCGQLAYCSAIAAGSPNTATRVASPGAVAGSSAQNIQVNASDADHIYLWIELRPLDNSAWNAGTWTIRLNITTANASVFWDQTDICRISSGCVSQASIGLEASPLQIDTTGVKTKTITGSSQVQSSGDKIMVLFTFRNIAGVGSNFQFTPDQNIDSPFDPPPPPQDAGRNWMYYNTAVRM